MKKEDTSIGFFVFLRLPFGPYGTSLFRVHIYTMDMFLAYLVASDTTWYRLVQIERPKLCPRLMTNAIPNQYAQIWYRRKAWEKMKRVTWLDFGVRRWAWRCRRKQV